MFSLAFVILCTAEYPPEVCLPGRVSARVSVILSRRVVGGLPYHNAMWKADPSSIGRRPYR